MLKQGADVSLEDKDGFSAIDRVGFSLDNPPFELVASTIELLKNSEFVFDTYIISDEMEINDKVKQPTVGEKAVAQAGISGAHKTNETHENVVWTQSGIVTAWSDAPIANFELDVDALLADELQHDADRESVNDAF